MFIWLSLLRIHLFCYLQFVNNCNYVYYYLFYKNTKSKIGTLLNIKDNISKLFQTRENWKIFIKLNTHNSIVSNKYLKILILLC